MSSWQPLADSDTGKGSPIGFFVVLVLVIAVYFLYRSMNRHLKRVPESFEPPAAAEPADPRLLPTDPQPPRSEEPADPTDSAQPVDPGAGEAVPGSVSPREPGPDRP